MYCEGKYIYICLSSGLLHDGDTIEWRFKKNSLRCFARVFFRFYWVLCWLASFDMEGWMERWYVKSTCMVHTMDGHICKSSPYVQLDMEVRNRESEKYERGCIVWRERERDTNDDVVLHNSILLPVSFFFPFNDFSSMRIRYLPLRTSSSCVPPPLGLLRQTKLSWGSVMWAELWRCPVNSEIWVHDVDEA